MFQELEHKSDPLAPRPVFLRRLALHFLVTMGIVGISLLIGTLGYHYWGDCDWLDAFLNASMILTGMGPVTTMTTVAGKLFSAFYALFSGIAFLTMVAVLMAPVAHRFLHRLHLEFEDDAK
jgi:hypothetical protein